ncbi:solute carrier family 25 member 35-like [Lycorma delicatula]|uniref:solute carrier family 25 member 35-like n=1 Tax=Lycorma delicatula TaxID=130591 RepID=UPI003F513F2C
MEFITGALAAVGAGCITNPIDVVKVRFQLQGELKSKGHYAVHYKNFFHAFYVIAKTDGIFALQKGLGPALGHQVLLNGTRLGVCQFAEERKWNVDESGKISIFDTVCIGTVAGIMGAYAGSPLYLVKTHLQSKAATNIAVGHQHDHHGTLQALRSIFKEHGFFGLWRGVIGACVRLGVGSCSQMTAFYLTLEYLEEHQVLTSQKNIMNTIVASAVAGTVASVFRNPFDVISTRLYNQGVDKDGRGLLYKSYMDCVHKLWQVEGISGLYKGLIPQFSRSGPHSILSLVFWDILKQFQY